MSNDTDLPNMELKASANTYWRVSVGLLAFALVPAALWAIVFVVVVGVICALIGTWICIGSHHDCVKRCGFATLAKLKIEHLDWFLILMLFAIALAEKEIDWLKIPLWISAAAVAILAYGNWPKNENERKT